jgi:uncharacterized membrane protein YbhN (UPF0104 family)
VTAAQGDKTAAKGENGAAASRGREADVQGLPRFLDALRTQGRRGAPLAIPLTVLAFVVNYAQGWLLARSLHLEISFFDVTCLLAIASLLGLLPISISGVGVREFFFALIFPALGYAPAAGVTFGLLVFAVLYLFVVGIGFVGWLVAPPPTGSGATGARPAASATRK